jgi:hypothetical protein
MRRAPHELSQSLLPLEQRLLPQVTPVQPQQIESIKAKWSPPAHQLIEQRASVPSGPHNLTVQNGGVGRKLLTNSCGQRFERLERIPVA